MTGVARPSLAEAPQPIMHVVGTRPNFVKAAPVVRALADRGVEPMVVHTGQHYDALLSDALFTELDLPEPVDNLGVGSGSHAQQTAVLLIGLEEVMVRRDPDFVVVYGDVNSTMSCPRRSTAGSPTNWRPCC